MKELLFRFEEARVLRDALERLKAADFISVETYTPMPLREEAAGGPGAVVPGAGSPLPLLMFAAGMLGFVGFFLLMTYADVHAYPLDIGGRPRLAWPAFIPIAFELGVLCAMAVGFFGYFVLCRMPALYDPVDECESIRGASRDAWLVRVRANDPERLSEVRAILQPLEPTSCEEFTG